MQRREPDAGEKRLTLLYFAWLAKKMRKESEQVIAPASVTDVASLLQWLGQYKRGATPLFQPERLRITVNKQFTEAFTRLQDGDEVALVPSSPSPPPTPDLI
ncbi:MoaD/ThiS family protein [Thiohalocapsa marina]|uniref:MoaD/ThiS family protein n=1 Tax=Thiohalocapsa marina TaxID=424902 RepID=UPI00319DAEE2